jgi:hypothetical protein
LISDAGMTVFNGSMQTLHEADVVLDVSLTDSFANNYNTWLLLVDSYDHATQVFTSKKNVYRIDGLTNRDGALGKDGHRRNKKVDPLDWFMHRLDRTSAVSP